jgi:hypothetical protein
VEPGGGKLRIEWCRFGVGWAFKMGCGALPRVTISVQDGCHWAAGRSRRPSVPGGTASSLSGTARHQSKAAPAANHYCGCPIGRAGRAAGVAGTPRPPRRAAGCRAAGAPAGRPSADSGPDRTPGRWPGIAADAGCARRGLAPAGQPARGCPMRVNGSASRSEHGVPHRGARARALKACRFPPSAPRWGRHRANRG